MSKPKIGIVGWSTGDNSFGVTKMYLHHLSIFGEVRILAPKEGTDTDLDLVILPGGKDTLSSRYGRVPGFFNSDPDQFKEAFIDINLKNYIDAGIPIWGTCLGFQQLVVFFGGTLVQNLIGHESSDVEKHGRGHAVNELIFTPKYKIYEERLLKLRPKMKKPIKVCSLHHQGVRFEMEADNFGLPEQLDVIAYTEDNIVECFKHKTLPIAGGQFHVEEDFNILGMNIIKELLMRSPNYKKNESISVVPKK